MLLFLVINWERRSDMGVLFLHIYKFVVKHRLISFLFLLVLLTFSILSIFRLEIVENIYKILPESKKINNMNFVLNNSKFMDKLILNISFSKTAESQDIDLLIKYSNELKDSLEKKLCTVLLLSR